MRLGLHTDQALGSRKYVVILADFPDVERKVPIPQVSSRMLGFVNSYFTSESHQKLAFEGSMTKRYVLPYPVGYYCRPSTLAPRIGPRC